MFHLSKILSASAVLVLSPIAALAKSGSAAVRVRDALHRDNALSFAGRLRFDLTFIVAGEAAEKQPPKQHWEITTDGRGQVSFQRTYPGSGECAPDVYGRSRATMWRGMGHDVLLCERSDAAIKAFSEADGVLMYVLEQPDRQVDDELAWILGNGWMGHGGAKDVKVERLEGNQDSEEVKADVQVGSQQYGLAFSPCANGRLVITRVERFPIGKAAAWRFYDHFQVGELWVPRSIVFTDGRGGILVYENVNGELADAAQTSFEPPAARDVLNHRAPCVATIS